MKDSAPNTTKQIERRLLVQSQYVRPYLLRNLKADSVNQVWQTDISYIEFGDDFLYLVAFIDVHSRYVTGWWSTKLYLQIKFGTPMLLSA